MLAIVNSVHTPPFPKPDGVYFQGGVLSSPLPSSLLSSSPHDCCCRRYRCRWVGVSAREGWSQLLEAAVRGSPFSVQGVELMGSDANPAPYVYLAGRQQAGGEAGWLSSASAAARWGMTDCVSFAFSTSSQAQTLVWSQYVWSLDC